MLQFPDNQTEKFAAEFSRKGSIAWDYVRNKVDVTKASEASPLCGSSTSFTSRGFFGDIKPFFCFSLPVIVSIGVGELVCGQTGSYCR